MSSQELRTFSSIELMPENRNLPGESFSIQGVSKWIHRSSLVPRVPLGSKPIHGTNDELVVLKRGGIVTPKERQRYASLV